MLFNFELTSEKWKFSFCLLSHSKIAWICFFFSLSRWNQYNRANANMHKLSILTFSRQQQNSLVTNILRAYNEMNGVVLLLMMVCAFVCLMNPCMHSAFNLTLHMRLCGCTVSLLNGSKQFLRSHSLAKTQIARMHVIWFCIRQNKRNTVGLRVVFWFTP